MTFVKGFRNATNKYMNDAHTATTTSNGGHVGKRKPKRAYDSQYGW